MVDCWLTLLFYWEGAPQLLLARACATSLPFSFVAPPFPPHPDPLQVSGLQRELTALRSSVANAEVLRREVHHLSRELLVERSKVKALGEELESPLNVHR